MNVQEALKKAIRKLDGRIPEAQLDAEFMVAAAVGLPRLQLVMEQSRQLTPDQEQRLERWIQERLTRKPLAYVLGEQPFMNLSLQVNPSVLIPRPETELLVEEALRVLDSLSQAQVADIGTGSGNIALALSQHPQVAKLFAIDISPDALTIAKQNALRNHIYKPIQWILGDLLRPLIDKQLKMDLIVANLPYIRRDEIVHLTPEVRWEPALALDGGREGIAYIASLIEEAEQVLQPEGILLLEIGYDQSRDVLEMLSAHEVWKNTAMIRDFAQHPRIIRAQKGVLLGFANY